jgi:tetratricopeptide (TPR) repeat protein
MWKTLSFGFILILLVSGHTVFSQDHEKISLAQEYYDGGDLDKAYALYQALARDLRSLPLIHQNYFKLMITTGRFDEAEAYLDRLIRRYPDNFYYQVDKGLLYRERNQKDLEQAHFDGLVRGVGSDPGRVRMYTQYLLQVQLYEYAIEAYKESRRQLNDPDAYAIQMAGIYRIMNMKREMIEEYVRYAENNPENRSTIENLLQSLLVEEEDLSIFEAFMYEKIQQHPNDPMYVEFLVWVNLQQKNFQGAFVQARALDRRMRLDGNGVMEVGRIALENKEYNTAVRIFEYVVGEYTGTPNYQLARRLLIYAREETVKNVFPVDLVQIRLLIRDYNLLLGELGINNNTAEALRSVALLHAFYLGEYDSAAAILNRIIGTPRIPKNVADQSRLDLGDIYLLTGEPWESTLLYSQVEKSGKETPIGYEAKLRNAKLSYYKGDFALAQSHLDILKMATSREIANDAMALSLLIKENTLMDTSDQAMVRFAAVDFLIFQNKKQAAADSLKLLRQQFSGHPLSDDLLWREANIRLELGQFGEAVLLLDELTDQYGHDILGDDALFTKALIFEEHLRDRDKAMELYQEFLLSFPGSNYAAESRKRFRRLRGDVL